MPNAHGTPRCELHGIKVKTYYYHLRRVRESLLTESRVVPLSTKNISDNIEIFSGDVRITLPCGCPGETLSTVLKVLKNAQWSCLWLWSISCYRINPKERYTQRQEHSKKILDGFYACLETVNPSQETGSCQSGSVCTKREELSLRFPWRPTDSDRQQPCRKSGKAVCHRQEKPVVFFLAERADASAIAYSIINSAQANGIDVREYLTTIFRTGELRLPLKSE